MSLHVITPEAQQAIRRQHKRQAISSAIIGILCIALILLILSLIFLAPLTKDTPVIVSYQYEQQQEKVDKPEPKETVQKKPSAPTANINKVITSNVVTEVAVPVPDFDVPMPSNDFGIGGDFGSGWSNGSGSGSGSASFFNTKTKAQRVAYVIDYSASMGGKREKLMRTELARSVGELKGSIEYQLIFFAGPAWVAGDEIKGSKNDPVITSQDGNSFEWITVGGAHGFKPKDEKKAQQPSWLKATGSQIKKSTTLIQETKLVWGTTWDPAINMALSMEPKPDVIFFMTDGSCGGNMVKLGEEIGTKAKEKGVIINTVAMMEPKTKEAMLRISETSGGTFTLIKEDGKPYDKDGRPVGQPND